VLGGNLLCLWKDHKHCPGSQETDSSQAENPVRSTRRVWITVAVLGLLTVFPAMRGQTNTAGPARLQTPRAVAEGTAKLAGHYNSTQKMRLVIGLKPPHMEEEEQFLKELQRKGSKEFHHYLTAKEWNERFGPSIEDERAVADWAQSQGLTVTHRYSNRLLVDVEAPASTIEKAFGVTMNSYQMGAKSFFSNDRDPVLPAHLTKVVQSVGGLNNLYAMRPMSKSAKEPEFADYAPEVAGAQGSSGSHDGSRAVLKTAMSKLHHKGVSPNMTNGAFDPTDLYSSEAYDTNALYNLGFCCNPRHVSGGSPNTASIAIATVGTQDGNDFKGFSNQYPYLAYHWQQIYVDGTPACCDSEGTIDMEWATAMSNSFGSYLDTSTVYLYDGVNAYISTFNDIYNRILTDSKARIMMTGWGCAEYSCYDSPDLNTAHNIFSQMSGEGWTLVAPSGDQGPTAGCSNVNAVQFPASDPIVVAVGGTTLSLTDGWLYNSEVAMTGGPYGCADGDGGSGGGESKAFGIPEYQEFYSWPNGSVFVVYNGRGVPDLALNADPINSPQNVFFGGSLFATGGTSLGAAEMAGFFAQENAYIEYLASFIPRMDPIGDPHNALYAFTWSGVSPIYPFYIITAGCNNNDITAANGNLAVQCAGTPYSEVTGVGSINMLQLAWDLNWYQVNPGEAATALAATFSGPTTDQWYNTDQVISWNVTNIPGDGTYGAGVSGYTSTWDYAIHSSFWEATPGSGNSFYDGPAAPNATNGSAYLSEAGQGCHTVHLSAWDHVGSELYDQTYGPVCYDTLAPQTTASLSGTLNGTAYQGSVNVTLGVNDTFNNIAGSGVASTTYQVDGGAQQTYAGPFTVTAVGNHTVTFHSSDKVGNVEATESIGFMIQ